VDPRYVDLIKMVTAVNHPVPVDPRAGMIRLFADDARAAPPEVQGRDRFPGV
jgi:hypothetical protein